jgi:hypothetical protein
MLVGVVLIPVYTRVFSPEQYGVVDLISTMVALLNLFLFVGLDSAVGRYYADTDEDRDKKKTASTGLYYLIASTITGVVLLVWFSREISNLVFGDPMYSLVYRGICVVSKPPQVSISTHCLYGHLNRVFAVSDRSDRIFRCVSEVGYHWNLHGEPDRFCCFLGCWTLDHKKQLCLCLLFREAKGTPLLRCAACPPVSGPLCHDLF